MYKEIGPSVTHVDKELVVLPVVNLGVNRHGSLYDNNKRLSSLFRERVLDLNHVNMSQQQISELMRTSHHFVQNILCEYHHTNSSIPTSRAVHLRTKITKIRSLSKIQTNPFCVVTNV